MRRSLYSPAAIAYYGGFAFASTFVLGVATVASNLPAPRGNFGRDFLLFMALEVLVGWFYFKLDRITVVTSFETPILLTALLIQGPIFAAWLGFASHLIVSPLRIYRRVRGEGLVRPRAYNIVAAATAAGLRGFMWLAAGWVYSKLAGGTFFTGVFTPKNLLAAAAAFATAVVVNTVVLGVGEWLQGSSIRNFLIGSRPDAIKEAILFPLGLVMAQCFSSLGLLPFLILAFMLALGSWVLKDLTQTRFSLEKKVEHLSILNEIGIAITSTLDLEELLAVVTEQTGKIMPTDNFFIALYDEPTASLTFEVLIDQGQRYQRTTLPIGNSLTGRIVETKMPILLRRGEDAQAYDVAPSRVASRNDTESFLGVPILLGARVLGVVAVQSYERGAFDVSDREILQIIANAAAVAIENVNLYGELGELNKNLEHKVGDRTRELQDANIKIREADRMKSQFLANMSHELRTPLNSIIGFAEVLEEKLAAVISERHRKFLTNILMSGRHLLRIINDILDLSKIEAGKMEVYPQEFLLREVVDGVTTIMKPLTSRKNITLDVELPPDLPTLYADDGKLKQILYNLLTNAVKFSAEGETVYLVARHVPERDSTLGCDSVEISVIDRGVGIRKEDQELIFHEFFQSDGGGKARHTEGTGLGLTLTRKFVELHGGKLWLQSALGRGSTFTLLMPRRFIPSALREDTLAGVTFESLAAGREIRPEPAARPEATKPLIMVVEDDREAWEMLSAHLAQAGYRTVNANSGEEAIRLARTLRPSAITLDLVLPDKEGWDVLKILKADTATHDIPVIIISMVDNRELGFSLGAADYFVKPVGRRELLRRLASLQIEPNPPDGPTRLLLIDDDPQVAEYLASILEPEGYKLSHALDGPAGLRLTAEERPDAIILDLLMPGINGFDVALDLKANEKSKDIPIIVYTAKELTPGDRALLQGKVSALVGKGDGGKRLIREIQSVKRARA